MADSPARTVRWGGALATATAALFLLSACDVATVADVPPTSGTELRTYADPPSRPPTAMLDGYPLDQASAVWRVGSSMVSYAPSDATQVAFNNVAVSSGEMVIVLDSAVSPMQAEVRSFSLLTTQGIPASDVPEMTSPCVVGDRIYPETLCWIDSAAETLEVHIDRAAFTPGVQVVEMFYATQTEAGVAEGVNHYAVSWAFRTS